MIDIGGISDRLEKIHDFCIDPRLLYIYKREWQVDITLTLSLKKCEFEGKNHFIHSNLVKVAPSKAVFIKNMLATCSA